MPMPLIPTLLFLSLSLAVALWAWWQDRKPHQPGKLPLISPTMVFYVAIIFSVLMLAHLIGLVIGHQFEGRMRF